MEYRGPYRVRTVQKPEPQIEHPSDAIVQVLRSCGSEPQMPCVMTMIASHKASSSESTVRFETTDGSILMLVAVEFLRQRRVAGTEVVERDLDAGVAKRQQLVVTTAYPPSNTVTVVRDNGGRAGS